MHGIQDGSNRNPFLNHLVIENILKYVHPVQELKILRLVSQNWNEIVRTKLLKSSTVLINSELKIRKYFSDFPEICPHNSFHLKLLSSLNSPTIQAFQKYILQDAEELHLSKCVLSPKEILKIICEGHRLKILSLNEAVIEDAFDEESHYSEDSLNLDEHYVSNLRHLEVTTCDEGDEFPWDQVFGITPKLQVLHAQLHCSYMLTSMLENLLNKGIKLEEFSSFIVDFETEQVHLLSSLEMPLRVLDLSLGSNVTNASVQAFLSVPSMQNLGNLKLFYESQELNSLRIPFLPNLKSLELMGDSLHFSMLENIQSTCPNLRHLYVSHIIEALADSTGATPSQNVKPKHPPNSRLSDLCIEEGYLSPQSLLMISKMFPNLRKVCLFLNDSNIGSLFTNFTCLREIIVCGTELTDNGVLGTTINTQNASGITSCKNLRRFSLYPQPQVHITDKTILHGLIHLPELTNVELPETAITNNALRKLLKTNPHLVRLSAKIAIDCQTGNHYLRSTKYQLL